MNILFVCNNSREATILTFELTKNIPGVQVQTVFDTQDALKELHDSGSFDAIMFDSSVSRGDCSVLADAVRQGNKKIRILFLLEPDTKEIPRPLNDIGIDRFIPKRPGYGAVLAEFLQSHAEVPQGSVPAAPGGKAVKKVKVLYAGSETAELTQHFSLTPNLTLIQIPMGADGSLKFPKQGDTSIGDLIVIDSEMTGVQTLNAIKSARLKTPDVPVIVMIQAGDEDTAQRATSATAAACVVKSGNYFQKLIPVIEKEILVRDLTREREIFKTRGSRLRQIVESLPVGVGQIAPSGTILAINQAGVRILGANNLNQVAGKNLLQLAPAEEREKILAFLSTVTGWAGASIRITWKGLNGSSANLELRGTPLLRDPGGAACVLTTIHLTSSVVAAPGKNDDLQQKCDALTQSLKTYEAQFRELQQKFNVAEERCRTLEVTHQVTEDDGHTSAAEFTELQVAHRELEDRLRSASAAQSDLETRLKEKEEQLSTSEEAMEQAEARLAQKEKELRAEYEQKLFKEKEQTALFQDALSRTEEQLQQTTNIPAGEKEQLIAEKEALEEKLRVVEKERNTLASSVAAIDSDRKRRTGDLAVEKSKYEKQLAELEQRCRTAEEKRAAIETERDSLNEEQQRLKAKIEEIEALNAHADASQTDAEARFQKTVEKYESEKIDHQQAVRKLEEKLRNAEAQRLAAQIALQNSEERLTELSNPANAESGNAARDDFEDKYRAAEAQSDALQTALKAAESRLTKLIERYRNEQSVQQKVQQELELKLQTAEAQNKAAQVALQDSIEKQKEAVADSRRNTEDNASRVVEKYKEEIAQLEAARKNNEQKLQTADQLRVKLQNDLREAQDKVEELVQKYTFSEKARMDLEREHAKAERSAVESDDKNSRCQKLAQYTSVGMIVADRDGAVLECNDIAARMFGYEDATMALGKTGKNRFRLYAFKGLLGERLKEDGKLENIGWTFQDKDGRLVQIQEYATLVPSADDGEPVVERMLMDVSRTQMRGEEIRHLRKLESTGDLAVATVKSFQDLCVSLTQSSEGLLKTGNDEEVKKLAESIRLKASRGIKYANRFIAASRKMEKMPTLLNFNDVVTENSSLLQSLSGEDIDLQMVFEPHLGWIAAEQSEVVQLISNIMNVAREVLPMGGSITIETANVEAVGGNEDEPSDLPSGIYVCVVFSIDGCAAHPERRNSSIRSVVNGMGGWLATGNDPQKGNVTTIYLPRVEVFPVAE